MELTYYRKGDYLFPNLAVQDEPQTIGKYGMLRRTYLKENRKNWYQSMLMSGKLNQHLAQIEEAAESRVETLLDSLNKRLADRQLKVELTDAAMNAVIDQGFDPVYGARPLKRFIQSKIETLVAKHIIAADVKPGDTLTIDANENGELYMRW